MTVTPLPSAYQERGSSTSASVPLVTAGTDATAMVGDQQMEPFWACHCLCMTIYLANTVHVYVFFLSVFCLSSALLSSSIFLTLTPYCTLSLNLFHFLTILSQFLQLCLHVFLSVCLTLFLSPPYLPLSSTH